MSPPNNKQGLIGRCCSWFCSWLVLVPLFSCCAFLFRLNQVHPSPSPRFSPHLPPGHAPHLLLLLLLLLLLRLRLLLLLLRRLLLLLLLYSFLPSSSSTELVVPVANDTAYTITVVYRYSSWDARGTKLIDQYSSVMRSIGCCSSRHLLLKLLLIYGSVFVSSSSSSSCSLLFCFSLRVPASVHINFPWGNLSPLPPCLLPCSGLLSSQRLIHSTWRYFAGGGANLVYDQ